MSSNPPQPRSPLAHFMSAARGGAPDSPAGVVISEQPYLGHLNLRGDPADGAFMAAVQGVLGFAPPTTPNTVSSGEGLLALWLGPDEWLIVTPQDEQSPLADALDQALAGASAFASVTDVTGGQTVINLSGENARDALAKGCTLDLHPRVFTQGQCAQTLIAGANATIHCVDAAPSLDIIVRRSFAEYLALWLHDAAQEYGAAVIQIRSD